MITSLDERLNAFIDALRRRGMPVSLSERLDAMRAVEASELTGLHTALSATLIKNSEHRSSFEPLYDLYFRTPAASDPVVADEPAEAFEALVRAALREGTAELSRLAAEQAVARFAHFEPGRPVAGVWYERQAMNGMRLPGAASELGMGPAQLAERTAQLRADVRQVIRELLVGDRGVEAVSDAVASPLLADLVIPRATPEQQREMQRALRLLQRKLATTLMRKRRHRRGPLDVRRTVHASMSTGGVPIKVLHKHPRPTKPDLFVLADMSGSVASFAAFTVSLISGMSDQFSRFECFAFIENSVDVTKIFKDHDDPADALKAVNALPALRAASARTDYGWALRDFATMISPRLGRRSTVLIFGDGRGNYRPPGIEHLAEIARRAGSVHWLNPEQPSLWNTGDSRMKAYAPLCTEAVSCRTLNDLRAFIERLD